MVGKLTFKVDGLKELDAALGELSKATARKVLQRTLLKAAQPMVDAAKRLAPKGETGQLSDSIIASTQTGKGGDPGSAAYEEVRRAGGSKSDAVSAMRNARRSGGSGDGFAAVYVGPAKSTKRNAIKAVVQEFGSAKQAPQAYLRPALNSTKDAVLEGVRRELSGEIAKAAARAAKIKARKGARK